MKRQPLPEYRAATGRQHGQAMTEYLVICLVLALWLFAPLPGSGQTAGQLLASKIRAFYSDLTFFISLP
jgi:hypothetical protein